MADAKEAKGHGGDEKGYKDGWADENGGASEGKTAEAKDDGHDGGFGDSALDARRRHWPRAEPFCPVDGGALTRGIRLIACEPAATRGTELLVLSEEDDNGDEMKEGEPKEVLVGIRRDPSSGQAEGEGGGGAHSFDASEGNMWLHDETVSNRHACFTFKYEMTSARSSEGTADVLLDEGGSTNGTFLLARSAEGTWLELELEKFDPKSLIGASYVRFGLHTVFALRATDVALSGLAPSAGWVDSKAATAREPAPEASMRADGWDDSGIEAAYASIGDV